MSTAPLRLPLGVARPREGRVAAGVCAGLAARGRTDATLVRLAFALFSLAAGAGLVAYLGLWALLPEEPAVAVPRRRRVAGVILVLIAAQVALHGLGLGNSLVWPLILVSLAYVTWTNGDDLGMRPRARRVVAGVLVVFAVFGFVGTNARGTASTLLAPGAVAVALLLVLVPWAWRLVRERDAERDARVRVEERADLAARVHDSVLQTLALIQREPDPRRVQTLARRQERELRAWLYPDREPAAAGTLADAIESASAEIEELHGVRVEVVRTGDAPVDERVRELVLAAREAMGNAAKHSGVEEVSVFVDASPERISVYVRDRGVGFDPGAVPADRRGIAHSIRERMERVHGTATIASAPGGGTEVELELVS
ncbi:MAG TPA: PspC domain-containing protein [Gaiellaceae bacterium]|nr:PspC domain-containing protein [Gaiellaceae bacterium]